jgi:dipeptidyl-peptidase 4
MYHKSLLFVAVVLHAITGQAQKQITLEDCFQKFKFYPAEVEGFAFTPDGKQYTVLQDNTIRLRDIEKSQFDSLLWSIPQNIPVVGYTLSENQQTVLLFTQKEPVYRHSFLAKYYAQRKGKSTLLPVGGKNETLQYCALSPDGSKALFVKENNIYYQDLIQANIVQVTTDGKKNEIINGLPDWVYEEEFNPVDQSGLVAVRWSPDGSKIAFLRFDESAVQEFSLIKYEQDMYPHTETFKYPKVGTANSIVTAHVYELATGAKKQVFTGAAGDHYLPRINWTPNNQLVTTRLNRHQDSLQLFICQTDTRQDLDILPSRLLLTETDSAYIDVEIIDYLTFLKDNKQFIWASERDNTTQLYLYDMDGKLERQMTTGRESITKFYGIDEQKRQLYVQTSYDPVMRMVWEMPMDGGEVRILSAESEGYHEATFSPTFDYWVHKDQNHNRVPVYKLRRRDGTIVRVLEENAEKAALLAEYDFREKELFQIPINKQHKMKCWMIKPPNFDETKKYPVLIDVYGGPGSQTVTFAYDGYMDAWRQMLAQKGYLVVQVDARGTGGRTRDFKKSTHMQLGKLETEDYILAGRYLGVLPFVDRGRVGIWGWSYGGFLSTNAMLKGDSTFRAAIAVAPVTNWKWYNTAYTERYLHTYTENPKGYDDNSPIYFADKLKGKYLLCHGMADDNVHWQHSVAMMDALIKAGKQFETVQYPNRDHGIYTDGAMMHLFTKITDFILKNL